MLVRTDVKPPKRPPKRPPNPPKIHLVPPLMTGPTIVLPVATPIASGAMTPTETRVGTAVLMTASTPVTAIVDTRGTPATGTVAATAAVPATAPATTAI